jgi:hypothetical protein
MPDSSFFDFAFGGVAPLGMTSGQTPPRRSMADRPDADLRYLEDRVDRLSLICMAMWSLMRDKTDLTEEQLMERVKLIDLMDGEEDGKATRTVMQCTACNRPMNPRHKKCLYCGNQKLIQSAFDAL